MGCTCDYYRIAVGTLVEERPMTSENMRSYLEIALVATKEDIDLIPEK